MISHLLQLEHAVLQLARNFQITNTGRINEFRNHCTDIFKIFSNARSDDILVTKYNYQRAINVELNIVKEATSDESCLTRPRYYSYTAIGNYSFQSLESNRSKKSGSNAYQAIILMTNVMIGNRS